MSLENIGNLRIYSFEDRVHYNGRVVFDAVSIKLLMLEAERIKRVYEIETGEKID